MYLSVGPGSMPRHCCGNMLASACSWSCATDGAAVSEVCERTMDVSYNRPKHGLEGVIANVEIVIDHHVRVNVHVRP
jgi:hypothetical protein